MVLWKNYGYMDKEGNMEIIMILYRKLLKFDLPRKKHGRLPKTKKKMIYNGEKIDKIPKQLKDFEQFHSFKTDLLLKTIVNYSKL